MSSKMLAFWPVPDELQPVVQAELEKYGARAVFLPKELYEPYGSKPENLLIQKRDEFILNEIPDADLLLGGWINEEQFKAAKRMRWFHVPFAGVNHLLENQSLRESDVVITNAAGIMAPPLADQVMGYIIMHSRALPMQLDAQRRGEWLRVWGGSRLMELAGRTVGIIGYGRIGLEVAKRAKAFGMRTIATKNRVSGDYPELDRVLSPEQLPELLAESDYVVVTAPLTPETRGLIGKEQLAQMKPSGFIINIARGQLIKEGELIEVLQAGTIAGAALDVFEVEPLPEESPLWKLPNVIITPHSSGNFDQFRQRSTEFYLQNLRRWFTAQPLLNLVDKKRGY